MRRGSPARALAPLLLAALLLSGCSVPDLPNDHFYRLEVPEPDRRFQQPLFSGALRVSRFTTDGAVGGRPILFASYDRPFELQQYHYSYWVETPDRMLTDALAAYLRGANVAPTVLGPTGRGIAGHIVSGRLVRFERRVGEERATAVVALEITVEREFDGRQLMRARYAEEAPAAGMDMAETVLAFRRAVSSLFARFVADLAAL